jgi:predicted MPP superfamily phosphohydrolase
LLLSIKLKKVLHEIDIKHNLVASDILIFTSDLIDRGSESIATVEFALKLMLEHRCIFLLGNHERFFLEDYKKHRQEIVCDDVRSLALDHAGAGVEALLTSSKREAYFEFISGFAIYFLSRTDKIFISHAPIYRLVDPETALAIMNSLNPMSMDSKMATF